MKKFLTIITTLGSLFLIWCQKAPTINEQTNIIASGSEITQTETWSNQSGTTETMIKSFEECLNAWFPIMESYPRQCNDGTTTFIEEITQGTWTNIEETKTTIQTLEITWSTEATWKDYSTLEQKLKSMIERRSQPTETTTTQPTTNDQVTEDDIENLENIIDQIIK